MTTATASSRAPADASVRDSYDEDDEDEDYEDEDEDEDEFVYDENQGSLLVDQSDCEPGKYWMMYTDMADDVMMPCR